MEKHTSKMSKNELLFEEIYKYTDTVHETTKNITAKDQYKDQSMLIETESFTKMISKGKFRACWLTSEEIVRINNVAAYRIILQILTELELNNPIWRRSDEKKNGRWSSQNNAALKVLEENGILVPFRGTDVYYVYPTKIGCGVPLNIALAWRDLAKAKKITPDNIGSVKIRTLFRPKNKTRYRSASNELNSSSDS